MPIFTSGYEKIDPTPWLCGKTCPAVISGIVTYRDASHLTVEMARHLSGKLEGSLLRLGVFGLA
jgi:hypothetical protein